jgi:leader peptidase (prepilin peptidase) / N-methyltransferase
VTALAATSTPVGASRSAYWWAAVALACALIALAVGALAHIEVRPTLRWAAFGVVAWAAVEDVLTRRLRNVFTAPAFVLALAGADSLPYAALGAVLAPLPFLVIAIPKPDALGMGDVKLAIVAGALVGAFGVPMWWLGTALAGLVLALVAFARGGRQATLAYGPALVAGIGPVLW